MEIPAIFGVPAEFSLALSAVIRYAMMSMRDAEVRLLSLYSDYDEGGITVTVSDSGIHDESLEEYLAGVEPGNEKCLNGDRCLFSALDLLRHYGTEVSLERAAGVHKITLSFPVPQPR